MPGVAQSGQEWSRVDQCTREDQSEPDWTRVTQRGLELPRGVQKWPRVAPRMATWPHVAQSGPELPKVALSGLE